MEGWWSGGVGGGNHSQATVCSPQDSAPTTTLQKFRHSQPFVCTIRQFQAVCLSYLGRRKEEQLCVLPADPDVMPDVFVSRNKNAMCDGF